MTPGHYGYAGSTWHASSPLYLGQMTQEVPMEPWLLSVPPRATRVAPLAPRWTARPLVLAVDDDVTVLQLLAMVLAEEVPDAQLRTASTAHEAESAALAWTPDLILCDVRLPDEDGRHLLARLRTRPRLAHVASALMTGLDVSSRVLREEAAALHADLLRKPFHLPDLLHVIDHALAGQAASR